MFYVAAACTGALAGFVGVFKKILTIIQIVVPILLILSVSISVGKLMMNPDDKGEKIKHSIMNSLLAAIIVFLLPMILNLVLTVAGDTSSFTACWNSNGSFSSTGGYTSSGDSNNRRKTTIPDSSDYEPGTEKKNKNK